MHTHIHGGTMYIIYIYIYIHKININKDNDGEKKESEFNGTSTHLLDGYISASQTFFYILE